ncbi:MAG: dTDP-4-dehydrorhamnose reductase [Mycobacteriales bacterium]|nr:dTDP-4-dehydrorhamnose reductase [Mycobacteriales bacterium]
MTLALLITGCKGQLGSELVRRAHREADIPFARGIDLPEVDLTDPFAVRDTVEEWARVVRSDSPNHRLVVLNPAAYTAVDKAEEDEETAYAVNAAAPALLATACASVGARMVQLSTDYVFPGDANQPYEVDDPKGPTNAYGRTKLAGELAVRDLLPDASYVVRTAWLYGRGGPNFVKTMARLERERETLTVIDDQVGSPTWAGDLAAALLALARSDAPAGSYHGTNRGSTTWNGFARAVFEELGADPERVQPTDSASFVTAATRPAYSVLSPRAWDGAGLPPLPGWREALAEAFRVEGDALRG